MSIYSPAGRFLVIVHDLTPHTLALSRHIISQIQTLIGNAVAGAVVPCWQGNRIASDDGSFIKHVSEAYGELLLHGYTHYVAHAWTPVALLTAQANEFTGLTPAAAMQRLSAGQIAMAEHFGVATRGFVPPAWQPGPITPTLLKACGLTYLLGLDHMQMVDSGRQPLAVSSWDCGRFRALGLVGEALGAAQFLLRPSALPCIVLHPRDIERGYAVRALHLIRRLLANGWLPILPGELADRLALYKKE